MLPLVKPVCSLDVCNELAANFTIHDAIKILSKLSVSESESIVFSGIWKLLGLLFFLSAANATSELRAPKRLKTYLRTTRAYERGKDIHHIRAQEDEKTHAKFVCLPV